MGEVRKESPGGIWADPPGLGKVGMLVECEFVVRFGLFGGFLGEEGGELEEGELDGSLGERVLDGLEEADGSVESLGLVLGH